MILFLIWKTFIAFWSPRMCQAVDYHVSNAPPSFAISKVPARQTKPATDSIGGMSRAHCSRWTWDNPGLVIIDGVTYRPACPASSNLEVEAGGVLQQLQSEISVMMKRMLLIFSLNLEFRFHIFITFSLKPFWKWNRKLITKSACSHTLTFGIMVFVIANHFHDRRHHHWLHKYQSIISKTLLNKINPACVKSSKPQKQCNPFQLIYISIGYFHVDKNTL